LTAVITPSTLSITSAIKTISKPLPVPTIDWTNDTSFYLGVDSLTPLLQRLVTSTVTGMAVLPIQAPSTNASYLTSFNGPSIECDYVDPALDKSYWVAALHATEMNFTAINEGTGGFLPTPFTKANDGKVTLAHNTSAVFRSFLPGGVGFEGRASTDACFANSSCHLSLIFNKDWNLDLVDPACDINVSPAFKCYTAMSCWTTNTSYKANITYLNGNQHINLSTTPLPLLDNSDGGSRVGPNALSLFYALQTFITGNLTDNFDFEDESHKSAEYRVDRYRVTWSCGVEGFHAAG
jgi:hypothetical protein